MRPMDYIVPESAEAAVAILAERGEHACPLAGGTDLVVDLKHAPGNIHALVDVSGLAEFRGIEETDEGLRIGSMATYGEIMEHPTCLEKTPEVVAASHTVGAVQTRNLGTIGGNLVTCVPSADSAPALMVLDAEVTLVGTNGWRRMPIEDFFVGAAKDDSRAVRIIGRNLDSEAHAGQTVELLQVRAAQGPGAGAGECRCRPGIGRRSDCGASYCPWRRRTDPDSGREGGSPPGWSTSQRRVAGRGGQGRGDGNQTH